MKKIIPFAILLSISSNLNAKDSQAEIFLKSCFKDYVIAIDKISNESATQDIRQKCLSLDFNKNWKSLIKKNGADAFTLSQDIMPDWATDQKIKSIDELKHSADIVLGKGNEAQCLRVKFTEEKSKLKIESIKNCP